MSAFELLGQHLQGSVTNSEPLEFFYASEDIVTAGARTAMALSSIVQLLGKAQPPGILAVPPVHEVAKRMYAFLRIIVEPNPTPCLAIDQGHLLASSQVFDGFRPLGPCNSVRNAAAIAAAIQPEDKAGLFRSSAMHKRVYAKRTVGAYEARVAPLKKVEVRAPHQRPIGEDPEVLVALIGLYVHRGGNRRHFGRPTCVRLSGRW